MAALRFPAGVEDAGELVELGPTAHELRARGDRTVGRQTLELPDRHRAGESLNLHLAERAPLGAAGQSPPDRV